MERRHVLGPDFEPDNRLEIVEVTVIEISSTRQWMELVVRKIRDPALMAIILASIIEATIHIFSRS